jgi:hypothetical protein
MLRRVALVRNDVSMELSASVIRVGRIGELGTTLAVTDGYRWTTWPVCGLSNYCLVSFSGRTASVDCSRVLAQFLTAPTDDSTRRRSAAPRIPNPWNAGCGSQRPVVVHIYTSLSRR